MTNEHVNDLRDYLAERDAPCPGCGYNLRGLTGSSCPECAREFTLYELRAQAGKVGPNRWFWSAVAAEACLLMPLTLLFGNDAAAQACPLMCVVFFLFLVGLSTLLSRRENDRRFRQSELALAAWLGVAYTAMVVGIAGGWLLTHR